MKNTLMIALCSVGILATGCSKPHQPDSATLQGTWSGKEVGVKTTQGSPSLIVEGTRLEFHGANPGEWYKGTFSLQENATPKQFELAVTDCPFTNYVGKTAHGIYKIEGGKFTFAANEPGISAVPATFNAKGTREFVFTRKQ